MDHRSTFNAARSLAGSQLIVSCASLAALFVFVPTGERIVAAAFGGSLRQGIDRQSAVTFLLNMAIILFTWRRSKDLQNALTANELAEQAAHENAFVDHVTGLTNRRELMRVLTEDSQGGARSRLVVLELGCAAAQGLWLEQPLTAEEITALYNAESAGGLARYNLRAA